MNFPLQKTVSFTALLDFCLRPAPSYMRYMQIFAHKKKIGSISSAEPIKQSTSAIHKKINTAPVPQETHVIEKQGLEPVPIIDAVAFVQKRNYCKVLSLQNDAEKLQFLQKNQHLLVPQTVNVPITDLQETALHLAAAAAQDVLVKNLLRCKADATAQDICLNTPLHALATCDDTNKENAVYNIADSLLAQRAQPIVQNSDGRTVFEVAAKHSNNALMNFLSPHKTSHTGSAIFFRTWRVSKHYR